jgi:hypothetical protein
VLAAQDRCGRTRGRRDAGARGALGERSGPRHNGRSSVRGPAAHGGARAAGGAAQASARAGGRAGSRGAARAARPGVGPGASGGGRSGLSEPEAGRTARQREQAAARHGFGRSVAQRRGGARAGSGGARAGASWRAGLGRCVRGGPKSIASQTALARPKRRSASANAERVRKSAVQVMRLGCSRQQERGACAGGVKVHGSERVRAGE